MSPRGLTIDVGGRVPTQLAREDVVPGAVWLVTGNGGYNTEVEHPALHPTFTAGTPSPPGVNLLEIGG